MSSWISYAQSALGGVTSSAASYWQSAKLQIIELVLQGKKTTISKYIKNGLSKDNVEDASYAKSAVNFSFRTLQLNEDTFNELLDGLPFTVASGFVDKLSGKIPLNMLSGATEFKADTVRFVLRPIQQKDNEMSDIFQSALSDMNMDRSTLERLMSSNASRNEPEDEIEITLQEDLELASEEIQTIIADVTRNLSVTASNICIRVEQEDMDLHKGCALLIKVESVQSSDNDTSALTIEIPRISVSLEISPIVDQKWMPPSDKLRLCEILNGKIIVSQGKVGVDLPYSQGLLGPSTLHILQNIASMFSSSRNSPSAAPAPTSDSKEMSIELKCGYLGLSIAFEDCDDENTEEFFKRTSADVCQELFFEDDPCLKALSTNHLRLVASRASLSVFGGVCLDVGLISLYESSWDPVTGAHMASEVLVTDSSLDESETLTPRPSVSSDDQDDTEAFPSAPLRRFCRSETDLELRVEQNALLITLAPVALTVDPSLIDRLYYLLHPAVTSYQSWESRPSPGKPAQAKSNRIEWDITAPIVRLMIRVPIPTANPSHLPPKPKFRSEELWLDFYDMRLKLDGKGCPAYTPPDHCSSTHVLFREAFGYVVNENPRLSTAVPLATPPFKLLSFVGVAPRIDILTRSAVLAKHADYPEPLIPSPEGKERKSVAWRDLDDFEQTVAAGSHTVLCFDGDFKFSIDLHHACVVNNLISDVTSRDVWEPSLLSEEEEDDEEAVTPTMQSSLQWDDADISYIQESRSALRPLSIPSGLPRRLQQPSAPLHGISTIIRSNLLQVYLLGNAESETGEDNLIVQLMDARIFSVLNFCGDPRKYFVMRVRTLTAIHVPQSSPPIVVLRQRCNNKDQGSRDMLSLVSDMEINSKVGTKSIVAAVDIVGMGWTISSLLLTSLQPFFAFGSLPTPSYPHITPLIVYLQVYIKAIDSRAVLKPNKYQLSSSDYGDVDLLGLLSIDKTHMEIRGCVPAGLCTFIKLHEVSLAVSDRFPGLSVSQLLDGSSQSADDDGGGDDEPSAATLAKVISDSLIYVTKVTEEDSQSFPGRLPSSEFRITNEHLHVTTHSDSLGVFIKLIQLILKDDVEPKLSSSESAAAAAVNLREEFGVALTQSCEGEYIPVQSSDETRNRISDEMREILTGDQNNISDLGVTVINDQISPVLQNYESGVFDAEDPLLGRIILDFVSKQGNVTILSDDFPTIVADHFSGPDSSDIPDVLKCHPHLPKPDMRFLLNTLSVSWDLCEGPYWKESGSEPTGRTVMRVEFDGLSFSHDKYPAGCVLSTRMLCVAQEIVVTDQQHQVDKIILSRIRSAEAPPVIGDQAMRIEMGFLPLPGSACSPDATLDVSVAPLCLKLNQDVIDFISNHFSQMDQCHDVADSSGADVDAMRAIRERSTKKRSNELFFKHAKIHPTTIQLDIALANVEVLKNANLVFGTVDQRGISGIDQVVSGVAQVWRESFANQLHLLVGATVGVRTATNLAMTIGNETATVVDRALRFINLYGR